MPPNQLRLIELRSYHMPQGAPANRQKVKCFGALRLSSVRFANKKNRQALPTWRCESGYDRVRGEPTRWTTFSSGQHELNAEDNLTERFSAQFSMAVVHQILAAQSGFYEADRENIVCTMNIHPRRL
ncbi:hypothetical protein [Paraburkholderia unamae]|uniref:hypothetical protein n=1 Tax=Paraburkholderia unamae TaxID=219649 RepID=UPI001058029B|nr:hypothetical protein [Paraburkholderia unamae]